MRGEGGWSIGPLPFTFDKTNPIGMIFGTYNERSLYFPLNVTTWCLTGFHGNQSYINDVTSGYYLGFFLFKFEINDENQNYITVRIYCKVVSIL